jgi:hypothetical protein
MNQSSDQKLQLGRLQCWANNGEDMVGAICGVEQRFCAW